MSTEDLVAKRMQDSFAALDTFADLIEPASEIIADDEVKDLFRSGDKKKAIKTAIKKHKSAVIEILARLDGCEPETYEVGIFTLPVKVIKLLNSPEVQMLFTGQGQSEDGGFSGSVTETTMGAET